MLEIMFVSCAGGSGEGCSSLTSVLEPFSNVQLLIWPKNLNYYYLYDLFELPVDVVIESCNTSNDNV
jgi:hypothetical protein